MAFSAGIYSGGRATGNPARVSASGRANLSRDQAGVSGGVQAGGAMAIVVVLAGIWALDRYVFNVPFFKATGAKG